MKGNLKFTNCTFDYESRFLDVYKGSVTFTDSTIINMPLYITDSPYINAISSSLMMDNTKIQNAFYTEQNDSSFAPFLISLSLESSLKMDRNTISDISA